MRRYFSLFPMQKVFLFLLLFLLPLAETPSRVPVSEPVSVASTPETDEVDQLFDDMHLDGIVSYTAFRQAVTGYRKIEQKSKSIMTLIDFSKPSTEKRLYVLDMKTRNCFIPLSYHMAETAERTMQLLSPIKTVHTKVHLAFT